MIMLSNNMKMKTKGYLLIALAVTELSLLPVFLGLAVVNVSPLELLFYTFLVSTATSFVALIFAKKLRYLLYILANSRAFSILVIAGVFNYAFAQLFLTIAIKGTNPVVASLISKLWPLFLAIMLPFTVKIKVNRMQLIALFIGFVGVYFLVTHGSLLPRLYGIDFIGMAVLSTLSTAGSNVIIKGQNQDIFSQVFIFNAASLLFLALLITFFNVNFTPMNTYTLFSVLFLGTISYSLGALMFFYSFKLFDPLLISNATYLTPILTIFFSYLILGTKLYLYYLVSFAFIIAALLIQQRYANKAPTYKASYNKHVMQLPLFDLSGAFINTKNNEIINVIGRSGRALGVKLSSELASLKPELLDASKYGCIVFTTKEHKGYASADELEFIREITGAKEGDDVLVCIGKPEMAEKAINEYIEKVNMHEPSMHNMNSFVQ